jgi:hypothetical protein
VSTAQLIPLAIPMMAGPQILSAIIFITGDNPLRVSIAYVAAVAVAVAVGTLIFYELASLLDSSVSLHESSGETTAGEVIEIALVVLLLLASLRAYIGRQTSQPPKWMGKLQGVSPGRAFELGFVLILLMPSDFVIMLTTGVHLKGNGLPYWHNLALVGATTLVAALPLLLYVLFRRRAVAAMPRVRDWMNMHSWLVNIFVYAIFIALIV